MRGSRSMRDPSIPSGFAACVLALSAVWAGKGEGELHAMQCSQVLGLVHVFCPIQVDRTAPHLWAESVRSGARWMTAHGCGERSPVTQDNEQRLALNRRLPLRAALRSDLIFRRRRREEEERAFRRTVSPRIAISAIYQSSSRTKPCNVRITFSDPERGACGSATVATDSVVERAHRDMRRSRPRAKIRSRLSFIACGCLFRRFLRVAALASRPRSWAADT